MGWQLILPLVAQYGIPYAYQIWLIVTQHAEPTQAAWDALLALSQKPMLEFINDARARAGLPPLTSYDPAVDPGAPSKP